MHKKENTVLIRVEAVSGEHLIMRVLIAALILCIFGYLYFVGLSIMNVIANKEASVQSDRLQSTVGSLEQEYFELTKGITPEMAAQHGLSHTGTTAFVRRSTGVATNIRANEM